MRQIVLDTETTGLEVQEGDRLIEIGGIELIERRPTGERFHQLLNPGREIDEQATAVHGFTLADLKDKPGFADIVEDLLEFLKGAELVIHNAPFDLGFLRAELKLAGHDPGWLDEHCSVLDTLDLARRKYPRQRNSLDALCLRHQIDLSKRTLHGALHDAELLMQVYLVMTGGQSSLIGANPDAPQAAPEVIIESGAKPASGRVLKANAQELAEHQKWLDLLAEQAPDKNLWPPDEN